MATQTTTTIGPSTTTQTITTTRSRSNAPSSTSVQTTSRTDYAPQQPQPQPRSQPPPPQPGVKHHGSQIDPAHDHPRPDEMGHGYGESEEQHAAHAHFIPVPHFGLNPGQERILFYLFAVPSWCFNIAAGVVGSVKSTHWGTFIWTATVFQFLSWAAWWQTVVQMMQRASWVRDESNLQDRKRYLYLAVRLNRLMLPTAVISFCVFIVAYVRRDSTHDVVNWLLFLLIFIFNTVGCVMNAYNNITWESDRLEFEEGSSPYGNTLLSILGIPSKPSKEMVYQE